MCDNLLLANLLAFKESLDEFRGSLALAVRSLASLEQILGHLRVLMDCQAGVAIIMVMVTLLSGCCARRVINKIVRRMVRETVGLQLDRMERKIEDAAGLLSRIRFNYCANCGLDISFCTCRDSRAGMAGDASLEDTIEEAIEKARLEGGTPRSSTSSEDSEVILSHQLDPGSAMV